ncbi:urease accessory protein UreF [Halalkalibacter alkaliphilus]|uniref:Urease accessory protein UreF n=1 Tax=Halalkalibacter alkaliphilus TaxID=2917993 RepID=A0A9X2I7K3_9BACI|nr:urease accessory protein UreF [Halalkalibacter alkaliphilus]MCL7749527.1 urease accessory protein UreF [Halalkalibacter alkaliphilus]
MTKLLPLLQLSDSNFPSGAFSHSFGLETYIQGQIITDKQSFSQAISVYIRKQLTFVDGLACRLAYEALEQKELDKFFELDHLLYASSLAEETRLGNQRIGERMAKLCYELYPSSALQKYLQQMKEKKAYGHSAFVFAAVAHHLEIPIDTIVKTYLFTAVSSLVQNAVRGIPLGQTDGQKILVEIQPLIDKAVVRIFTLVEEDFGAISPGLEIAQMRHERLHVRLFMS